MLDFIATLAPARPSQHEGEHLFAVERIVVSPAAGLFTPSPEVGPGTRIEVGTVLGSVAGRSDDRERTIFKSLGLAVEDVASARFIYQQALATGAGTWLELGGLRPAT